MDLLRPEKFGTSRVDLTLKGDDIEYSLGANVIPWEFRAESKPPF